MQVINIESKKYPDSLRQLGNDAPQELYVKGNLKLLNKKQIGVIGTRHPCNQTQLFGGDLVKNLSDKYVITSGLALGSDKLAHTKCLESEGETIAVLPSGFNNIAPRQHSYLVDEILDNNGLIISEYNENYRAHRMSYIKRNRIVAGLSNAICVLECNVKSGTMHTVNYAIKYGKPLYAYSPFTNHGGNYSGNHKIIKYNNAIPLTKSNASEVLL